MTTVGSTKRTKLSLAALLVVGLLLAAAQMAPAAITQGPSTANRDPYEIFTIGDSAAAGEGAPDVDGFYNNVGDPFDIDRDGDFEFEDWDTRFGGSPAVPGANQDSTRCHRSGHTSTSAVARNLLQQEFPDIAFNWVSVACSGASIVQTGKFGTPPPNKGGLLRDYDGVDDLRKRGIAKESLSPDVYPPQLDQLNTILDGRPNGPTKRIDALVMNIGVNDAGFSEIVTDCLDIVPFPLNLPDGECHFHDDNKIPKFVTARLGLLNDRFNRLARALDGIPVPSRGDPDLRFQPAKVFLTALPNPLRPTATTFCDSRPPGNYEENLKAAESQWLEANVLAPVNARFDEEAEQHEWDFVDSHVNAFFGHAICTPDDFSTPLPEPWIRTNLAALRTQGKLDDVPIAVGGSIVHPNATGYAQIGTALKARMWPVVMDRYTPDSSPTMTPLSRSTGFTVTLGDANLPSLRSGYWHRLRLRQLNASGAVTNITPVQDVPYGTGSVDVPRTGRYFASARACGPLSRDGTRGCGPITSEQAVSTIVPARPVNLDVEGSGDDLQNVIKGAPAEIAVSWAHANQFALHDTRRSVVRVRLASSIKTVATKTVAGPFTSTRVTGLAPSTSYQVSVTACNDGNRCSTATAEQSARTAKSPPPIVEEPFAGLQFELQQIKIALQGVPCSTTPVTFDPLLAGSPGVEDATPTFQPLCPTDPPVGRLTLARQRLATRAARSVAVELRWRHPRRWRDLHEVSIQLRGRRGTLATLRFDQDANTLTLAPGARSRGTSLAAGRVGTLSSRGVKVRVAKDAVRGSGPTGASVRLRFRIILPRSARPGVVLAVGATDDTGQAQVPFPAGQIRVR